MIVAYSEQSKFLYNTRFFYCCLKEFVHNDQSTTRSEKKRKRPEFNQDDDELVNRSFSQLSISQPMKKKKKSTTNNNQSNRRASNADSDHRNNRDQLQKDNDSSSTNHITKFKPRYLRTSDKIFKQMLSNELEHSDNTIQCLDTKAKIQFVRQMTEATNDVYYFDLQRQLWQAYYDTGAREGVSTSRLPKSFAKQHHTCRTYGFPKHIIEKRQNEINQQLKQAIDILQQYLIELEENVKQWQPSVHSAILSNAINECVKHAQQRLRQEFDYKKKMLLFNCNDHQSIKQFYDLQPSEEQVLFHMHLQ